MQYYVVVITTKFITFAAAPSVLTPFESNQTNNNDNEDGRSRVVQGTVLYSISITMDERWYWLLELVCVSPLRQTRTVQDDGWSISCLDPA